MSKTIIARRLRSKLFHGDPKLEAAAVSDPAHVLPGASGPQILWIIFIAAVVFVGTGVLSWVFYTKGDAVRLMSMIVLALIVVISLVYFLFAAFCLIAEWNGDISKTIRSVGTFTLGFPIAALGSLALVIVLPAATNQSLRIEGAGFTLEGPTIQIILWVVCFLTIVSSMKLLQPGDQRGTAQQEGTSSTKK